VCCCCDATDRVVTHTLTLNSGSVERGVRERRSEEIWKEMINAEYRDGERKRMYEQMKRMGIN
jgi:hypothetical protein